MLPNLPKASARLAAALLLLACWPTVVLAQGRPKSDWDRYMLAARLAYGSGNYEEAEKQAKVALKYAENFWSNDPRTANTLTFLGELYRAQGRFAEAEQPFRKALGIAKEVFGKERTEYANYLDNLASAMEGQGRYAEAEPLLKESLGILEKVWGREALGIAPALDKLAANYYEQGRYEDAEPLYRRGLAVRKGALGSENEEVAAGMENYARVLKKLGRLGEAAEFENRAASIRAKLQRR